MTIDIKKRYIIIFVLTVGSVLMNCMVYCLTATTTYFQKNITNIYYFRYTTEDSCQRVKDFVSRHNISVKHASTTETIITNSFFIGFILSHIPFGAISDVNGGKHFIGLSVLTISVSFAFVPVVMRNFSQWLIAFGNVLIGIVLGINQTAGVSLLAHWLPDYQRTFIGSIYFSGETLGIMLGTYITARVHSAEKWESTFYLLPIPGIVYFGLYLFTVHSSVEKYPNSLPDEKELLKKGMYYPTKIPWRKILKDEAFWSLLSGQIGYICILILLAHNIPNYLKHVVGLDLNVGSMFHVMAVPHICLVAFTILSGYYADCKIKKGFIPLAYLRCFYIMFGSLLPPACSMLMTFARCNPLVITVAYSLIVIVAAPFCSGLRINVFDLTYYYAGTVYGIQCGIAGICYIVTPIIINCISRESLILVWRHIFYFNIVISIFTSLLYFISMRGERASWDYIN